LKAQVVRRVLILVRVISRCGKTLGKKPTGTTGAEHFRYGDIEVWGHRWKSTAVCSLYSAGRDAWTVLEARSSARVTYGTDSRPGVIIGKELEA
jgi:hypothetical protein